MKTVHIVTHFLVATALLVVTGCNSASKPNDEERGDIAPENSVSKTNDEERGEITPENSVSKPNEEGHEEIASEKESTNFWGHSTTFIFKNLQNGYKVSVFYKETEKGIYDMFRNDDICIWHFQRGDSIDRYLAGSVLPRSLFSENHTPLDTLTVDIPIVKQLDMDADNGDVCFMDVNFDGQEEFVIAHYGYNRMYYACFDLVNGNKHNVYPGFLAPIYGEVYGNLVGGMDGKTEFDHKNKIIHITEQMGCCETVETWAKPIKNSYGTSSEIRIFKKIDREWLGGEERITTYKLVNDTLKQVSHETIKY